MVTPDHDATDLQNGIPAQGRSNPGREVGSIGEHFSPFPLEITFYVCQSRFSSLIESSMFF
jgi:hypothetical protein